MVQITEAAIHAFHLSSITQPFLSSPSTSTSTSTQHHQSADDSIDPSLISSALSALSLPLPPTSSKATKTTTTTTVTPKRKEKGTPRSRTETRTDKGKERVGHPTPPTTPLSQDEISRYHASNPSPRPTPAASAYASGSVSGIKRKRSQKKDIGVGVVTQRTSFTYPLPVLKKLVSQSSRTAGNEGGQLRERDEATRIGSRSGKRHRIDISEERRMILPPFGEWQGFDHDANNEKRWDFSKMIWEGDDDDDDDDDGDGDDDGEVDEVDEEMMQVEGDSVSLSRPMTPNGTDRTPVPIANDCIANESSTTSPKTRKIPSTSTSTPTNAASVITPASKSKDGSKKKKEKKDKNVLVDKETQPPPPPPQPQSLSSASKSNKKDKKRKSLSSSTPLNSTPKPTTTTATTTTMDTPSSQDPLVTPSPLEKKKGKRKGPKWVTETPKV
ncbi:hypothetical protein IAR55_006619 [Kwoniella newhampshirensis]|uniref:Uncharacterized protein n=1 Tax=Kwoniella newhampshirensis TaxID=1651941 RepID=A0AAW0YUC9_9TREE